MRTDRVSVILPCYDEKRWIAGAIETVLAQTHENFELIIVDDGSTDGTGEIVRSFDDGRIRYVKQENRGPAGAVNTGIKESTAEYYALLDADDRWEEQKIERQLSVVDPAGPELVHSNAVYVDVDGTPIGRHHESPPVDSTDREQFIAKLFQNNFVCKPSVLCCASVLDNRQFDESLYANEDHDMWLRLAGEFEFAYVSEPLVQYRFHEGNISKAYEQLHRDRKVVARRAAEQYPFLRTRLGRKLSEIELTYAINLALDGKESNARTALQDSVRHGWTNWRAYVVYLLTYGPMSVLRSLSDAGKHY